MALVLVMTNVLKREGFQVGAQMSDLDLIPKNNVEVTYDEGSIAAKKVISAYDVGLIFFEKVHKRRKKYFERMSDRKFAGIFNLSKSYIQSLTPSRVDRISENNAVNIALGVIGSTASTLLSSTERKIYRKFLDDFREKRKVKSKSEDESEIIDTLVINEFISKFSNTEEVVVLLTWLLSPEGLSTGEQLTLTQKFALQEMIDFGFAKHAGNIIYFSDTHINDFRLLPILNKTLWSIGVSSSELHARRHYKIFNFITQTEIAKEDFDDLYKCCEELQEKISQSAKKAEGLKKEDIVSIISGSILSGYKKPILRD